MPESTNPSYPTRSENSLSAIFERCDNVDHPQNVGLKGYGAKIKHGDTELWLTRVEGLRTYHHVAAQTLEIAFEPQVGDWVDGLPSDSSPTKNAFWPTVSNEFMAKCFCGDLGAARELFLAIEAELATNKAVVESLIEYDILGDNPLQIYLHEFEPEGLGIVHFTFNYDWDGLQPLEDALRSKIPHVFAKLQGVYESEDYFGTYDWYCSDNFIDSTSPEIALAAWNHCLDQGNIRECVTGSGRREAKIVSLLAQIEAAEIDKVAAPGSEPAPTLRV